MAAVAKSITASPASAWLATAGAGQYPAASGFGRHPAQELGGFAQRGKRLIAVDPAAFVAVEQARHDGPAGGVDGGQRGNHRRNGYRAGLGAGYLLPYLVQGGQGPRRHASSASCSSRLGVGTRT